MSNSVDTYLGLVTSEHDDAPDFLATVALTVQGYVDEQAVLGSLSTAFNLDTAVGAQLDVVGQWIGISRYVSEPLVGVYFSLDVVGLGLDEGYLQGEFDPSSGLARLDDPTYRLLLYMRQGSNAWDGTIAGANAALALLFNSTTVPGTLVWAQDNLDMTMDFVMADAVPSALFVALFSEAYVGLVPGGVRANFYIVSASGYPAFGLDVENSYVSGLDVGALVVPA